MGVVLYRSLDYARDDRKGFIMTIAENIAAIQKRIAVLARDHHRAPDTVTLIAASKQQPDVHIDAALAAGHVVFGENRVQEAQRRWIPRRALYPHLQLHLIGPLQTNKVHDAVMLFDVIHTLDREKLADALQTEMIRQGRTLRCLVQVNTGDEPQKSGIAVKDLPRLLTHCRKIGLPVSGLMCIPPVGEDPAPHFQRLAALAHTHNLAHLSMGMSADYQTAIACGATLIRLGSGIFGARA